MPTGSERQPAGRSPGRRLGAVAFIAVALLGLDLAQAPERQLSARALLASVDLYQEVGHRLVPGVRCRLRPSCSRYAERVIREHGAVRGGWLAARRLLRCGPWTRSGTLDPPPGRVSSSGRPRA